MGQGGHRRRTSVAVGATTRLKTRCPVRFLKTGPRNCLSAEDAEFRPKRYLLAKLPEHTPKFMSSNRGEDISPPEVLVMAGSSLRFRYFTIKIMELFPNGASLVYRLRIRNTDDSPLELRRHFQAVKSTERPSFKNSSLRVRTSYPSARYRRAPAQGYAINPLLWI